MKPLGEILCDGTSVVDNTVHQIQGDFFSTGYRPELSIYNGNGAGSTCRAWRFLQQTATEINQQLRSGNWSDVVMLAGRDADYEHNTEDDFLTLHSSRDHTEFQFSTGNLIGCVKGKFDGYDYTLRVSSRFGDEFLKYIIADADGFVELPDQGGMERGDYEWLLVYFWLVKLKKAFRLGLPKAYTTRTESLTQVRGRFDPVDYFLNQQRARYRCTYREHSYDNDTTRLIARTLQHLDSHDFLCESHVLNQTFQIATQGQRSSLQDLLATPPVRNPYYADYNPVIALSKQILKNELLDFGAPSKASAFFFDVSMLFEYFVRKLLKRAGMAIREKSSPALAIPAGRRGDWRYKLIPDLVFELDEISYVFDIKYKSFDLNLGVKREDLFQMHTYIGQLSNEHRVGGCGFIYPIRESRWDANGLEETNGIISDTITQSGRKVPFYVVFLKIPEQKDIHGAEWSQTFRNSFKEYSKNFVRVFSDRLLLGSSFHVVDS
jgi:5-methylcytosine-specific restriction enzyme subunit McrC